MVDINKLKENNIVYLINNNEILQLKIDYIENILKLNAKGEKIIHKGIVGIFTDKKGFKIESYVDYNNYKEDIFKTEREANKKLIKVEEDKR